MLKLFCPSCFKATNYEQSPPSLCPHCHKPFLASLSNNKPSTPSQPSNPPKTKPVAIKPPLRNQANIVFDEDDDEQDVNFNPDSLESLAVQVNNLRPNREKIKLSQQEVNNVGEIEAEKTPKKQGKQKSSSNTENSSIAQQFSKRIKSNRGK